RRKRRMTLSVAARCRFASAHAAIQEASAAGQQAHGCRPDGGGRAPDAWGHLTDSFNVYWAAKKRGDRGAADGRPTFAAGITCTPAPLLRWLWVPETRVRFLPGAAPRGTVPGCLGGKPCRGENTIVRIFTHDPYGPARAHAAKEWNLMAKQKFERTK